MTDAQDQALFAIVLEIFQAGVKCGMDENAMGYPLLKTSVTELTAFIDSRINEKAQVRSGVRSVEIIDGETHILPSSPERET